MKTVSLTVVIASILILGILETSVYADNREPPFYAGFENSLHFEWFGDSFPNPLGNFAPSDEFSSVPIGFPLFDFSPLPTDGFLSICDPQDFFCLVVIPNFVDNLETKFVRVQVTYIGVTPTETAMEATNPDGSFTLCELQEPRFDDPGDDPGNLPGYYFEDYVCEPNPDFELYLIFELNAEITQIVIDTVSFTGEPRPPEPERQALFLIIDEDSIDNGNPPNFFSDVAVNDHIAAVGLREILPAFSGGNVGTVTSLYTGEVGDEGWFAPKTIPPSFVFNPDSEAFLDKIPDVTPLRATGLNSLVGERVCAVVYDSNISINYNPLNGSLKGANLGIVAFKVLSVTQLTGFSSSSLPEVRIVILDPSVCEGELELFTDAPEPISSSEPFDVVP